MPTCLGSLPVELEDQVIPAAEVLEVVYHLPADAEGIARRADSLIRLAHDNQLHISVVSESTYDAAVPRDRRDRGARCPVNIVRPVDLVRLAAQGYKRLEAELLVDSRNLLTQSELRLRVNPLCKGPDPLLETRRALGKGHRHLSCDDVGKRGEPLLHVLKGLTGRELQDRVLGDDSLHLLDARLIRDDVSCRQLRLRRVTHSALSHRGVVPLRCGEVGRNLAHLI